MRLRRGFALLVAIASSAIAWTVVPHAAAQDPDFENGVSVLFTMAGEDVRFRQLPEPGVPFGYVVTIAEPANRVTWFTDRPVRDAGTVPLKSFLRAWGPVGFHRDPPNAVIEITDGVDQSSVPATIENPRLRTDGALVFRATLLDETTPPKEAPSVSAFIDADDGSKEGSKEGSTWPMPKFRFVVDLGTP